MRNRIRNIIILMSVCILGIYFFQGYWLYRTYRIRQEEFGKEINEALRTAVYSKQFNDVRRLLGASHDRERGFGRSFPSVRAKDSVGRGAGFFAGKSDSLGGYMFFAHEDGEPRMGKRLKQDFRVRVVTRFPMIDSFVHIHPVESASAVSVPFYPARAAEAEEGLRFSGSIAANRFRFDTTFRTEADSARALPDGVSLRIYADSIAQQISDLLIINNVYKDRFSVKKLDSIYKHELRNRNIYTNYKLDTFQVNFGNMSREGFRDSLRFRGPLQTPRIPFNPLSNLFVQASFEAPVQYILKQMLWILAGSLALLLLTTTCFLYMMRTILKQKKLSEVKNDFINNMTHELKTPIATVYAAVEAMQNFNALNDQRKTRTYLDISKQELQRLSDLVEKVLHIAAEEKEDFDLFIEETDLNEVVENIMTNHQLKAGKPVTFHFHPLTQPLVEVDRTHLSNAISNLVDNAIKYSKEKADITIHLSRNNGRLTVSVKDHGIGIPKVYRENIFDKFFRVPTGNLHNVKGFGLGLSYVKKIVEKHHGTITVQSEPDTGSEFIIDIPA
ncbi:HAMP domain-containing histidine kinase [Chitinophaga horti]|uniref:histidine kinase n=1 Tax=Chitinophaga horti TaxID=2920382 RepID=A0ABY6IZF3_9BACT|nr:HAMP domain-containing sensor histidine kinase [Chitinophaga horti]UYQ92793.1 HAMP domain-containing histidine kinase [Chitinophaga horti]